MTHDLITKAARNAGLSREAKIACFKYREDDREIRAPLSEEPLPLERVGFEYNNLR
jgi:hypothetical protein